jgi:hypothetical protein
MNPEVLTAIQVALGKIEVTVENTSHRIRNIEARLDAYVPRQEIESKNKSLEERVTTLESENKKLLWYIIGLLVTILISVGGFAFKTLH